jgi:hypothetical protein
MPWPRQEALASALGCSPGSHALAAPPSASGADCASGAGGAGAGGAGNTGGLGPPPPTRAAQLQVAACWAVMRGVCSAMAGASKRRLVVCCAFINTVCTPQLFDLQVGRVGHGSSLLSL